MKKRVCALVAALMVLAVIFPCFGETMYVDNRETDKLYPERLNLRAEPSRNGGILGLYYTGAEVTVLGTENDYAQVEIGGVGGYMASEYLITAEEAAARYGEDSGFGSCRAAQVELDGLWIASVDVVGMVALESESVATLSDGDLVELVGILGDDWAYIAVPQKGRKVYGYVPLDMLVDVAVHDAMIVAGGSADTRTILYSAPNDKAEEIMSLKNGAACRSLFGRKEGNWVKVRVGGVSGWVRYTQADNLKTIALNDARSTIPYYPLVMKTKEEALLYSFPDETGSVHETLEKGTAVEIFAEAGEWVYVRTLVGDPGAYDCGAYGYVALSSLTLAESQGAFAVAQADDDDLPVLLMDAPEKEAKMIGALIPGAQVRIIDFTQTDYVKVALGDVEAYVLKAHIRALGDGSAKPSERIPQRAYVNGGATLLDQPNGAGDTQLEHDSRVYMLAVLGDYAYVQADEKLGFEASEVTMGFVPLSKLDAPASTTHLTAHVTKDKINMRKAGSRDADIVGKARLGECLRITDYGLEWTCVVTPEGKRGYVMTQYLTFE